MAGAIHLTALCVCVCVCCILSLTAVFVLFDKAFHRGSAVLVGFFFSSFSFFVKGQSVKRARQKEERERGMDKQSCKSHIQSE